MSAPSESVPGTVNGVSGGPAAISADGSKAAFPWRGRAEPLADDASTVELAFSVHAEVTCGQASCEPGPGTVLGSRYLLEELIGRGGTSSVYRARDLCPTLFPDTPTHIAVKVSRGTPRTEPGSMTRLHREFQTMRDLSHAGIAQVFALDRDGELWFMSMQLLTGQTLKAWMAAGGGYAEALKIIDTCCAALEYAHSQGVVHGDLKPTNILVSDDGTAKLIDFGSSSIPGIPGGLGPDPAVAATPMYASPQILAGQRAEQLDDVFSLACLSYSLLSGGRHPYGGRPSFEAFRAKSAPTYVQAIPVELFEVIERGLSADRDRRPASVSDFRRELARAEQHRRVKACLSHPVRSNLAEKSSRETPIPRFAMARLAPTIVAWKKMLGNSQGWKRATPIVASLVALMVAGTTGALVLSSHSEPAVSGRTAAVGLPQTRIDTPHASTTALNASILPFAPAPDPAPSPSTTIASVPHDASSISFNAAIIHASARQSLVAITVRRSPADRNAGAFVWRVERGTAVPAIDYARVKPQRVNFMEGQTVRTLFIPLVDKSTRRASFGPRFFDVVLQSVNGGPALGRFGRITVVIDPMPTLWVAKSEVGSNTLR